MPKLSDVGQYLNPKTVKTFSSPFNEKIEVVTFSGSLRLDINDLTQSGTVIEKIWSKAFKDLLPSDFQPQNILVLGLAGGSVLKPINKNWPQVKVTAVEIDPLIIKIAKKHFKVKPSPKLNIVNQDAIDYVNNLDKDFDLCLVDCYLGDQFPSALETIDFYKKLKNNCSHVLINRIFWGKYQEPALNFKQKLEKDFSVSSTRTTSNLLLGL